MKKIIQGFTDDCGNWFRRSLCKLYAQEKGGMVKYTPDFRFNDGIYLNFDQVKTNSPIPKAKILTSTDYNDKDFFKNLLVGRKDLFLRRHGYQAGN